MSLLPFSVFQEQVNVFFFVALQDFAGSGVVHMLSGLVSLVACWHMGPRLGRFDSQGKPLDIAGHSVPMAALGGFILLFGFLAFNGGSQVGRGKFLFYFIITVVFVVVVATAAVAVIGFFGGGGGGGGDNYVCYCRSRMLVLYART